MLYSVFHSCLIDLSFASATSSGVYFNDATKAVLEAKGKTFQYIERRKIENDDGVVKMNGPVCEAYSLEAYPEELEKKVTLLKHFRNYSCSSVVVNHLNCKN